MELLDNQKQSTFHTFFNGKAKVTFDDNGYIVQIKDLSTIMWCTPNQDEELIGKHIVELAAMLKIYGSVHDVYIGFLENVVLDFYINKVKNRTHEFEMKEEKGKALIRTK